MYISREIDHILLDWKNSDRHKPLILRGVRQCGKTSAVRNLSQQFGDYIELNLEKEPDIGKIFEGELNCSLRPPAVANAFRNGRCAEHNGRRLLVT